MPTAKSQTVSLGLHVTAVALLVFLTSHAIVTPPPPAVPIHKVTPLAPLHRVFLRQPDHAGGSNHTALPAKHGAPPPRASRTFIEPPMADPKLPMPVSIAIESPPIAVTYDPGDPLSKYRDGMLGNRGGQGIGSGGPDGGIAKGRPGHEVSQPVLVYKVEPEFSEDARKAKYSGIVLLAIEVDANGRPRAFRVLQSPGLGLDQKAIEAVT